MAWGLEARVPFLDHEVVELAGRIPPELKLADGGKGVLKRASRGVVPDEVIDRTKGYFPVPAIRQLEGPYLDRVREALSDPAAQAPRAVPARGRRRPAGRPERHPDDPGLQRAVAARPAGDVAAARMTSAEVTATQRRARWSPPGAAGVRPCRRTAARSPSSATAAGRPSSGCRSCRRPAREPPPATWSRLTDDPVLAVSWSADGALAGLPRSPPAAGYAPRCGWCGRTGRTPGGWPAARTSTPSSGRGPAAGTGWW